MVLDWAASGAMALTGQADGAPIPSPAPVLAMLSVVTDQFAQVTRNTGTWVSADPAELITVRAALAGFNRRGRVSAGGSSYLLRAADGWCAVTLSRRDDLAAVPAILGVLGLTAAEPAAEPPAALAAAAPGRMVVRDSVLGPAVVSSARLRRLGYVRTRRLVDRGTGQWVELWTRRSVSG